MEDDARPLPQALSEADVLRSDQLPSGKAPRGSIKVLETTEAQVMQRKINPCLITSILCVSEQRLPLPTYWCRVYWRSPVWVR